jgi:hypothetical protein
VTSYAAKLEPTPNFASIKTEPNEQSNGRTEEAAPSAASVAAAITTVPTHQQKLESNAAIDAARTTALAVADSARTSPTLHDPAVEAPSTDAGVSSGVETSRLEEARMKLRHALRAKKRALNEISTSMIQRIDSAENSAPSSQKLVPQTVPSIGGRDFSRRLPRLTSRSSPCPTPNIPVIEASRPDSASFATLLITNISSSGPAELTRFYESPVMLSEDTPEAVSSSAMEPSDGPRPLTALDLTAPLHVRIEALKQKMATRQKIVFAKEKKKRLEVHLGGQQSQRSSENLLVEAQMGLANSQTTNKESADSSLAACASFGETGANSNEVASHTSNLASRNEIENRMVEALRLRAISHYRHSIAKQEILLAEQSERLKQTDKACADRQEELSARPINDAELLQAKIHQMQVRTEIAGKQLALTQVQINNTRQQLEALRSSAAAPVSPAPVEPRAKVSDPGNVF